MCVYENVDDELCAFIRVFTPWCSDFVDDLLDFFFPMIDCGFPFENSRL